jgi:valyl-tRNA synthetase
MADSYVDMSFGTGAMKCTPAHDPNDFALAKKYGFPLIKVLDETAHMNERRANIKGWTATNAGKPSSKRSKKKAIS